MLFQTFLTGACLLLGLNQCRGQGFQGFYETNYNETITICTFDEARGVLLGRTHWPHTPFNEDSAALQGVLVTDSWLYGNGATITGGAYSFSMRTAAGTLNPSGTFTFLDKEEEGAWNWTYLRPATDAECEQVTLVRKLESAEL
jgi:hypothetical protein